MNIEVKWLIEDSIFGENLQPIVDEIRRQGMEVTIFKYRPFIDLVLDQYSEDDCVIALGSLNAISQVRRRSKWVPGCFANFPNFDCMKYYAYYGKYLLNQNYYILPFGELQRLCKENYQPLKMFVRPCSGTKEFTGQVLTAYDILLDTYTRVDLPVVVADFRKLKSEYRLFCTDYNTILAGSRYYDENNIWNPKAIDMLSPTSEESVVLEFARMVLKDATWHPDPIFVMDIGIDEHDKIGIVELNSFSCSGWYETPPKELVRVASEIAIMDYKSVL